MSVDFPAPPFWVAKATKTGSVISIQWYVVVETADRRAAPVRALVGIADAGVKIALCPTVRQVPGDWKVQPRNHTAFLLNGHPLRG